MICKFILLVGVFVNTCHINALEKTSKYRFKKGYKCTVYIGTPQIEARHSCEEIKEAIGIPDQQDSQSTDSPILKDHQE